MNGLRVLFLVGLNVMFQASAMLLMLPVALLYGEWDQIAVFLASALLVTTVGGAMIWLGYRAPVLIFRREALAVVAFSWLTAAFAGTVPFYFGGLSDSYADCVFEAFSGLTTTGASILTDIEALPKALLMYRTFLHFIGGIGIVVLFVAIFPAIGGSGRALFRQEVTGPVSDGLTPRIRDTAISLFKLYIALNVITFVAYIVVGKPVFESINHAISTVATGGFATSNDSLAGFSIGAEWVAIIFMFVCGANFTLHLDAARGRFRSYWRNTEFRAYTTIVLSCAIFFTAALYITGSVAVSEEGKIPFRDALFTTVSIITTTGFGTVDFNQWPEFCRYLILVMMFFGGMAGSTAGGMKIIRHYLAFRLVGAQLRAEVSPHEVRTLKVDGRPVEQRIIIEVLIFFVVFLLVFAISALAVCLLMPRQDLITSISAAAACLNNVGPGLGEVGPAANYGLQSAPTKWLLSFLMLLGRLELFVLLILFMPRFWLDR